jgi:hypothetical protein
VNYLVGKYHPRVVASEQDWTMMETKLEFESARLDTYIASTERSASSPPSSISTC